MSTQLHPPKIYLCPPIEIVHPPKIYLPTPPLTTSYPQKNTQASPPTHKKCPLTPTYPKYTSNHLRSPPPNHKKCPSTPTHPKYTSTHPNLSIKMSNYYHPPKTYLHLPPTTPKLNELVLYRSSDDKRRWQNGKRSICEMKTALKIVKLYDFKGVFF